MENAYKLAKEAFVSNLNGGSITEINAVTLVAPVCLLYPVLALRFIFDADEKNVT